MPENIVLVGFMSSGKSTVGKILAARIGWDFIDTDAVIESNTGLTITEIFKGYGEAFFRELEKKVVADTRQLRRTVIATGGGAVLTPENVEVMKKGNKVVWLKVKAEEVMGRIGRDRERPLTKGKSEEEIKSMLKYRESFYRFADLDIETDGLGALEVALNTEEALANWLKGLK